MAEGPIRRACNRCHTQKLSCKRLGNEPCERCVRLKAECKSSPSLRFRKSSNSTTNSTKSSSLRQSSTSQQEQRPQKRMGGMGSLPAYTKAGIPYPGPYSFNGMAEQLWPGHNVDAGLLIYHSDGNQIYQALPPQQIGFQMDTTKFFRQGLVMSPMEEAVDSSQLFNATSTGLALPLMAGYSQPWSAPGVSHSPCATGLVASNGNIWKGGMESNTAPQTSREAAYLPQLSHNGDYTGNNLSVSECRSNSTHSSLDGSPQKQHMVEHGPLKTVPKSLISELCDMSSQLWDMSNAISVTGSGYNGISGEMSVSQNNPQTMASSTNVFNSHDNNQSDAHGGNKSPVGSTHDRYFPMDSLFAVSRNFILTVQIACYGQDDEPGPSSSTVFDANTMGSKPGLGASPFARTNSTKSNTAQDMSNGRVDAENFVVLAESTYAALLDVYQRVFHLVDVTASNERPPSPPHNGNGNDNGSRKAHFVASTESNLKQSLHSVMASSWKDSAALSCLKVCRFPDVSVGGFPIVSTPALQLGLGLRLADDFLAQFSNVVAAMHSCFPSTSRGHNTVAASEALNHQKQQLLPMVSRSFLPHPPLVISEDLFSNEGLGAPMDWDASTATSVSSSSRSNSLFSLQYGLGMHRPPSSMDDIVLREHDLRQELAGLRNKLAA